MLALLALGPAPGDALVATPAALAAAAEDAVRTACPGPGVLVLECGPVPPLGDLLGEPVELRARALGQPRADGALPVCVEVWQNGERRARPTVVVRLRRYQPLLVAAEALSRGEVPQPAQLRFEPQAACAGGDAGYTEVKQLQGMRLKRALAPGEPVLRRDLEPCPVVRRGDRVLAALDAGGLHLTIHGTALADGTLGQRIAVKHDLGSRRLWGWITGPGAVRVDPADVNGGG